MALSNALIVFVVLTIVLGTVDSSPIDESVRLWMTSHGLRMTARMPAASNSGTGDGSDPMPAMEDVDIDRDQREYQRQEKEKRVQTEVERVLEKPHWVRGCVADGFECSGDSDCCSGDCSDEIWPSISKCVR